MTILTRGLGNPSAIVTRGLGSGVGIIVFRSILSAVGAVSNASEQDSSAIATVDVAATVTGLLGLDATGANVASLIATLSGAERTQLATAVDDQLADITGATERLSALIKAFGLVDMVEDVTDYTDGLESP